MSPELVMLALSAAAIAFIHTILGPDHYLPFIAMAKARGWPMRKTLRITLLCGAGHLGGSVALGLVGIAIGAQLAALEWPEGLRGDLAAWLLIGFGLAYTAWGVRLALRNRDKVYVINDDNELEIRTVEVLSTSEERVLVTSGVAEGDRVVTSPVPNAVDGMAVEPLFRKAQS